MIQNRQVIASYLNQFAIPNLQETYKTLSIYFFLNPTFFAKKINARFPNPKIRVLRWSKNAKLISLLFSAETLVKNLLRKEIMFAEPN